MANQTVFISCCDCIIWRFANDVACNFDQVQPKICLTGKATWFGNESNTVNWICHTNSTIKMLSLKLMSILFQVLSRTCTPSMIPHYLCHFVISLLSLHNFDKFCHSSFFPAQICFVFGHMQSQSNLHLLLFS